MKKKKKTQIWVIVGYYWNSHWIVDKASWSVALSFLTEWRHYSLHRAAGAWRPWKLPVLQLTQISLKTFWTFVFLLYLSCPILHLFALDYISLIGQVPLHREDTLLTGPALCSYTSAYHSMAKTNLIIFLAEHQPSKFRLSKFDNFCASLISDSQLCTKLVSYYTF